jgi:hypothetical protein
MLDPKEQAEKTLREHWSSDVFPADPIKIAQLLGIRVVAVELDDGIFGLIRKNKGFAPLFT